jgi:D-threonine aldolase
MHRRELPTPALVVRRSTFDANLALMARRWPDHSLRPHVKAHKSTALARQQAAIGHRAFTCATPREVIGMATAGLDADLLLANECIDPARLSAMARCSPNVTIAVDSDVTVALAARHGITKVLIDVNVGLPRCGVAPADAGRLADLARSHGLVVRGVMGYEGHAMGLADAAERRAIVERSMDKLRAAHTLTGGDVISAGGTMTWDLHHDSGITEMQAGSYALMDSFFAAHGAPFASALFADATVINVSPHHIVCDAGLKALAMDHGLPTTDAGEVWFLSDEHATIKPTRAFTIGDRVSFIPSHVDPTVAYHREMHVVDDQDNVIDVWPVDLRHW